MSGIKKLRQKLPDPLDVWGGKAEQARKDAKEQAELDRKAMAANAPTSAPTLADDSVTAAREEERRRRAAAAGQSSTILTGANGLSGGASGGKTLLGQ